MLQNRLFFSLWRRAAISDAVARSSIVFLNSVSASSCDSAVHEGKGHRYQTLRLLAVYDRFRTAGSSCAQQRGCVSAASTATNAYVLQSANLRNLLQRKVEEEGNLESQNLMIDIGFEEMAALKHSLKIA